MDIIVDLTIASPIDKLWKIAADDFGNVHHWASTLDHSSATTQGKALPGAPCTTRVCKTNNGMGGFSETLTRFDPARHILAYTAKGDKMPGFVKRVENTWTMTAQGPNATRVQMHVVMDVAFPFSVLMGWMMKMQFRKVMAQSLEDLRHYAETGQPHPRKVQADEKSALAA